MRGKDHGYRFSYASALGTRRAVADQLGIVTGLCYAVLVTDVALGTPAMATVAALTTAAAGIWAGSWVSLVGIGLVARAVVVPERSAGPVAAAERTR